MVQSDRPMIAETFDQIDYGEAMAHNMTGAAYECNGGLIERELEFQERRLGRITGFLRENYPWR